MTSHPPWIVAAMYRFAPMADLAQVRDRMLAQGQAQGIIGTLILAPEGLNGTIAGRRAGMDAMLAWLRAIPGLEPLEVKESTADAPPFYRFKVRLKEELVPLGHPEVEPSQGVGEYVEPEDWNRLVDDPEVLMVDTRNTYEVEAGTFRNAIHPKTETFREFAPWVEHVLEQDKTRPIAMFCTGGIRCEKATALLVQKGFQKVYHLKGGILKYLERVPSTDSRWEGECFVFDHRVTVGHGYAPGETIMCFGCSRPVSARDQQAPEYEAGVSCPACHDKLTDARRAAARERQKQIRLAAARGQQHLLGPK
jgi:UPF0176 protein